jgi:hypothetical protein
VIGEEDHSASVLSKAASFDQRAWISLLSRESSRGYLSTVFPDAWIHSIDDPQKREEARHDTDRYSFEWDPSKKTVKFRIEGKRGTKHRHAMTAEDAATVAEALWSLGYTFKPDSEW